MPDKPAPGWSRWYCRRCRRPLACYPSEGKNDHVSHVAGTDPPKMTHDGCGGSVAFSVREAQA